MKISFRYDDGVAVVPKKVLDKSAAQASREDLLVLLSLAADPATPAAERAEALRIGEDELEQSISFWKRNKIISVELAEGEKLPAYKKKNAESDSEASSASAKNIRAKRPLRDNSLPTYTAEELASALDVPDSRKLIEYCQQSFGRIFNMSESEKVIGIVDYLGVSTDYVAMLCSHLASDGKRSVRALETEAISLYDRGITDFQGLIEYLDLREKSGALEARVRKLFGIGKRTFTPKEQAFVEAWTKSALPFDIVEHAYEVTVNATGEASMPYANSVLESWINSGFSTLDEIKKSEEKYKKSAKPKGRKQQESPAESSFATDDFFEAALRRSYGDAESDSGGDGK